jgi:hypothetical protein
MITFDVRDVLRWVDRMLIRLCAKYADYRVYCLITVVADVT